MSPTFASLSIRNYRIYFTGALLSNVGTWMGRVAQDWLVLVELTDHDSTALGIVTALQFAPVVLLAPVAGTLADRFRKRRVLAVTQTGLAVTAALLALLTLTGVVQLWQVYLLAALQGFFTAADNPTRQAFVSEMVPPERLGNAVGLNSASFNAARLIGPAVAGLLIAWVGTGWTLVVNTFSFVAVLVALQLMRGNELHPAPRGKGRGGIREGLAYVRHRPDLMLIMAIVFMLGTFGMNFQITTALMATTVFHKGATEFGLLGSIMAIGSLSAALLSARRSQPRLRVLLGALAGFVVASAGAATAPTYELFALWLIPVGLTALTVLPTANTMVQLSVAPHLRGRVMALYMAIFLGGTPIGAPLIGWIGAEYGARWTIGIGSVATAVAVVGATMYVMRTDDLRVRYRVHERPHLQVLRRGEAADAVTPERVA